MNNFGSICGRFAPSPSGMLHLGNLSSLLLAWLDARALGGKIVFRLEDLDPARSKKEYAEGIMSDMRRLGLNWDEYPGINNQSGRTALYDGAFELLRQKGLLYPCYCSRNQRLAASAPHESYAHDRSVCRCKTLSASECRTLEAAGKRPAWKVSVPDSEIVFTDGHYGLQRVNLANDGDFIIRRSDGIYAYQLAVSFDDMDMGISRVVRGRDLLSSTAKQIWLIRQLGGSAPDYCHAPLILLGDRKMSKRFGDLSTAVLLKEHCPEEITGILAKLLGLRESDAPISPNELLQSFSWDKIPTEDIVFHYGK